MHPITIIIVCLLLSAVFSGLEIAFISANRLRLQLDIKQGRWTARVVNVFYKSQPRFIATLLLSNNVVLVIYSIIVAQLLQPIVGSIFHAEYVILLVQTIISTLIIVVAAEFIPKAVFRQLSNFMLKFWSLPALALYYLLYPFTALIVFITQVFLRRVLKSTPTDKQEMYVFGKVDVDHFIKEASTGNEDSSNVQQEIRIFQNALEFPQVKVRDCMVPRTDIASVEDTISMDELRDTFVKTGFSKLIVYHQNIDEIIGYVGSKDLFRNPLGIEPILISLPIVPETMNANVLLQKLLQERKSIALVVDEFGGTSGIVTTEDIIEEIVGEIEDEHDTTELVEKSVSDNTFILSGKLQVDYLNSKYDLEIPISDEYDTLAGFITHSLGRIPRQNEVFDTIPFTGKIIRARKNRIELVFVRKE